MRQAPLIATCFHNMPGGGFGQPAIFTSKIALSGGCFQNRYLTERVINHLSAEGFNYCVTSAERRRIALGRFGLRSSGLHSESDLRRNR